MFFLFRQNNSGGRLDINEKLSHFVIVEAKNAKKANKIAKSLGIYFNGVAKGLDCSCCGDRWEKVTDDDGQTLTQIINEVVVIGEVWGKFKDFNPEENFRVHSKVKKIDPLTNPES